MQIVHREASCYSRQRGSLSAKNYYICALLGKDLLLYASILFILISPVRVLLYAIQASECIEFGKDPDSFYPLPIEITREALQESQFKNVLDCDETCKSKSHSGS